LSECAEYRFKSTEEDGPIFIVTPLEGFSALWLIGSFFVLGLDHRVYRHQAKVRASEKPLFDPIHFVSVQTGLAYYNAYSFQLMKGKSGSVRKFQHLYGYDILVFLQIL
jgi:hypothetical protein